MEGKGWKVELNASAEPRGRLYLADNSYSRVHYCASANSRDGGNKQRLQKRQTNDSTLHSKLFSSDMGCLYRVTLKVKVKESYSIYCADDLKVFYKKMQIKKYIHY